MVTRRIAARTAAYLAVCAVLACSGTSSDTGGSGSGNDSGTPDGGGGGDSTGGSSGSSGGGAANPEGGNLEGGATGPDAGDASPSEAGAIDSGAESDAGGFNPCPQAGTCKILPLGDSITAGAGAQPGDGGGYRVELFTKAANANQHITFVGSLSSGPDTVAGVAFPKNHEGHIGWTIDQIRSIATTAQTVTVSGQSMPGALRDMPQIVLLFIGTNDEGYASSQPGASDRLGQLIDTIVAALPDSLLVVSSIYPFPGCTAPNCAAAVTAYDAAIPGVVQQRADMGQHVIYVDMSNLPSTGLSTDGVHPNDTVGYPWMGDNWYAAIKQYLH